MKNIKGICEETIITNKLVKDYKENKISKEKLIEQLGLLRKGRKFWIARNKNQWDVCNQKGKVVCSFPVNCYDNNLTHDVCYAKNTNEVKRVIKKYSYEKRLKTHS